jgi:hypothetical protein
MKELDNLGHCITWNLVIYESIQHSMSVEQPFLKYLLVIIDEINGFKEMTQ